MATSADAVAPELRLTDAELLKESNIAQLEAFVRHQSATVGVYNAKFSRALLRLYQMFPARLNRDFVVQILAKAVTILPEPDFQLVWYLVPESLRTHESVTALVKLQTALETGRFGDFWALTKEASTRTILDSINGFDEAAQATILRVLGRLSQKVDLAMLQTDLNLTDASSLLASHGWAIDGKTAVAPVIPENTARPKKATEDALKYSEVAGLVQIMTR